MLDVDLKSCYNTDIRLDEIQKAISLKKISLKNIAIERNIIYGRFEFNQ